MSCRGLIQHKAFSSPGAPKQFRAKVASLQALADAVRVGEASLAQLENEGKAWVSEVEKHFRMAGPKKRGSAGAAVGSVPETVRLLEKISVQLEQMTEVLCHLLRVQRTKAFSRGVGK
ncbi:hypothetical protein EMPG_11715 [Blastomyces silverae]|uniref:Uncharacterized protein n=1 Tax=Blastomyces silverae TaxID=2060906 RepID=A0A0H1BPW0_9EURO|nr:hypothetical protein EMPG_11715 [Blastomyces silverae]